MINKEEYEEEDFQNDLDEEEDENRFQEFVREAKQRLIQKARKNFKRESK